MAVNMIIAVNTRSLSMEGQDEKAVFINECFSRLATQFPEHRFLYFSDKPIDPGFLLFPNIIPVITGKPVKNTLQLSYWYNYKVPGLLRKHKADVFISDGGCCSLRTKIPQCVIVNDLAFLPGAASSAFPVPGFYKKQVPRSLKKATSLVALAGTIRTVLADRFGIDHSTINIASPAAGIAYHPVDWQTKEKTRATYSKDDEYFLYRGPIGESSILMNLVKAFSFFKKRQKSNMKLVLAGYPGPGFARFSDTLSSFKFREDVVILPNPSAETTAALTAAAYTIVFPGEYPGISLPLVQAMQSEIAVIAPRSAIITEIAADAAFYLDTADVSDIAEKMMTLFKDETKRDRHIAAGKLNAVAYTWEKTTATLWTSIVKATTV